MNPDKTLANEMLLVLLSNTRNTLATLGEGSPQYASATATLRDHLTYMQQRGWRTDITSTLATLRQAESSRSTDAMVLDSDVSSSTDDTNTTKSQRGQSNIEALIQDIESKFALQ